MICSLNNESLQKLFNPISPTIRWANRLEKITYMLASSILGVLTLGVGHLIYAFSCWLCPPKHAIQKNALIKPPTDTKKSLTIPIQKIASAEKQPIQILKVEEVEKKYSASKWTPEKISAFLEEIKPLTEPQDAKLTIDETLQSDPSPESMKCVNDALEMIEEITLSHNDFFEKLNSLSPHELAEFSLRLNNAPKTRLEHLWKRESVVQFSESDNLAKEERLGIIFKNLKDEPFNFSLTCPSFIKMMSQAPCAKAAAQTFDFKQLACFAQEASAHSALKEIIKKMPADKFLLGKIAAIIPYTTPEFSKELCQVISHLRLETTRPNFNKIKIKLENLAAYLALENQRVKLDRQMKNLQQLRLRSSSTPTLKPSKPLKQWAEVQANTTPRYRTPSPALALKKWRQEELIHFIASFTALGKSENQLLNELNTMDSESIQTVIKELSDEGLSKYWRLESKTLQAQSEIECRNKRLSIVFSALSPIQLNFSIQSESFLCLLSNHTNGCSAVAAASLTGSQLAIIGANYAAHPHLRFVLDYLPINENTLGTLKAILPCNSPWLEKSIQKIIQVKMRGKIDLETKNQLLSLFKRGLNQFYSNEKLVQEWAVFKMKNPSW